MIRLFILLLALLLSFSCVFGQVREAKKEMLLYNFSEAIELLKKAIDRGKPETTHEATPLLAECYRQMNNWHEAKRWYAMSIARGNPVSDNYFHYGQALRNTGNYEGAKRMFLIYDSLSPQNPRGKLLAGYCDSVMNWQKNPPVYEIKNASSFNSLQSEFGTVFYGNGVLFTSDRKIRKQEEKSYGWTGNNYLRLFVAEYKHGDSLSPDYLEPEPAPGLFNHSWHDGPASFNRDLDEAIINRTLYFRDKGKRDPGHIRTHLLKLYRASKEDEKWSKPKAFFLNSNEYSVGHPALTPDGQTLFFVSDMPGGFGGTDIYQIKRKDGKWSNPENLGPEINTSGNEMFPFVTEKGELYFASDRHPGFGGLDIFITCFREGKWARPHNLGIPVNSSYDDFSLATDRTGNQGFFSSNRPGGIGNDDIYFFRHKGTKAQSTEAQDTSLQSSVHSPQKPVASFELNKAYLLENIYYDFDRWDIRDDAKPSLDSLVRIMQTYPVSIELGSHTDCRGTEAYNRDLSQKRAESAVAYMISKGIEAERITARGYGESALINRCDCSMGIICTKREHQENRRTEFRILDRGMDPPLPE